MASVKQENRVVGLSGEEQAWQHLREKKYQLVARNFQTDLGEIDLIVRDEHTLVFVEVKTRRSEQWGDPFKAVTATKQRKIIQVALAYIQQHNVNNCDFRFDVVSIVAVPGKDVEINHYPAAFDAHVSSYLF